VPQSVEVSRQAVINAIRRGARRVPDVIHETKLSDTTVRTRLTELEAAGEIRVHPRRGRGGSQIEVLAGSGPLAERVEGSPESALGPVATALPVATVWLSTALSNQAKAAGELRSTGAQAVLDCSGDFDLLAVYPASRVHDALRVARELSEDRSIERVSYGLIVGPDRISNV
jgi:hypothetical protein